MSHKSKIVFSVPSLAGLFVQVVFFTLLWTACHNDSRKAQQAFDATVFTSGTDGYSHYRIPSLAMNDEFLFAFAEGRKHGSADHGEISIVLKRSSDGGRTWGNQAVVVESAGGSAQNPTPVWVPARQTLILLFTRRTAGSDTEHMIRSGTSEGYMGVYQTESQDQGLSWSQAREITAGVKPPEWRWYALGPGGAITLKYNGEHPGRIIVPANHSTSGGSSNEFLGAHVLYSDDLGRTWTIGAIDSQGQGTINPNETVVVELLNGDLYFNTRSQSAGDSISNRGVTVSHDGGASFVAAFRHEPQLVTPVVHASMTRNGTTLFFLAPDNPAERLDLRLWESRDEGQTWIFNQPLYHGPSAYSSCCMPDEETLDILFEADDYGRILFKSLPLSIPAAERQQGD